MPRSRRRTQREWENLIGEQARSGLSAKEFCQSKSIGLASFYQWRRRLRDGSQSTCTTEQVQTTKESFIDMGRIGLADVSTPASVTPWIVTLDLGDNLKLTLQRR